MKTRIVLEGNSFYEIDEECLEKKEKSGGWRQEEQKAKEQKNKERRNGNSEN